MTHPELVTALVKSGGDIVNQMSARKANLIHMAIGISSEAGELLDCIKKKAIYNQVLDYTNVIEELGDLEFFMEGLRQELNLTREIVLQENIKKLTLRYGKVYSDKAAQDRADKR